MLDRVDETLETQIHRNPSLLLIQPADQQQQQRQQQSSTLASAGAKAEAEADAVVASSDDVAEGGGDGSSSSRAGEVVLYCLKFLAVLMRNCVNKHVFCSSEVCACVLCVWSACVSV